MVIMNKATVQKLIAAYNKNAREYNKIRKKLVTIAQQDTQAGRAAYKQLKKKYTKAMAERKKVTSALKVYLAASKTKTQKK